MSIGIWLGYMTIGAVIGWASSAFTGERGIKMLPSLFFGVIGALMGSSMVHAVELAGAGYVAVISSIAVLFTVHAFRQEDPIFEEAKV